MLRFNRVKFDIQRFGGYRPGFTELGQARQSMLSAIGRAASATWRSILNHSFVVLFGSISLLILVAVIATAPRELFNTEFWFSTPEDVRTLVLVFASIGGAAVATIALWLSSKRTRAALDQSHVAQENHYTDLLVRAGEHLSHENMLVRLVGVHSLDRVGRHSEQDRPAVASILAQFLQQRLPNATSLDVGELRKQGAEILDAPGDIEAAANSLSRMMHHLTELGGFPITLNSLVIPRRGVIGDCENWEFEKCAIIESELDGARFNNCLFDKTLFYNCTFNIAWFTKSTFIDTGFSQCYFPTTGFMETYWQGGRYFNLNFGRSYFSKATFLGTHFYECDFHHVDFRGAKFLGARFTKCEFSGAYLDECTFQNPEDTFIDCHYHKDNSPFVSNEVDLSNPRCFKTHDAEQGIIKTR